MGDRPIRAAGLLERLVPERARRELFLFVLERGFLDGALDRFVVTPFLSVARQLTEVDRRLCDALIASSVSLDAGEERDE